MTKLQERTEKMIGTLERHSYKIEDLPRQNMQAVSMEYEGKERALGFIKYPDDRHKDDMPYFWTFDTNHLPPQARVLRRYSRFINSIWKKEDQGNH